MPSVLHLLVYEGRDDRPNDLGYWQHVLLRRGLEQLLTEGRVRRIPAIKPLHPSYDEEWYLDEESGDLVSVPGWGKIQPELGES